MLSGTQIYQNNLGLLSSSRICGCQRPRSLKIAANTATIRDALFSRIPSPRKHSTPNYRRDNILGLPGVLGHLGDLIERRLQIHASRRSHSAFSIEGKAAEAPIECQCGSRTTSARLAPTIPSANVIYNPNAFQPGDASVPGAIADWAHSFALHYVDNVVGGSPTSCHDFDPMRLLKLTTIW